MYTNDLNTVYSDLHWSIWLGSLHTSNKNRTNFLCSTSYRFKSMCPPKAQLDISVPTTSNLTHSSFLNENKVNISSSQQQQKNKFVIKLQIFILTVKIHHKLHLQCRFLNHEHLTCTEYAEFWLRLKLCTSFNGTS